MREYPGFVNAKKMTVAPGIPLLGNAGKKL
jgi:hypothetical protein